jgi:hypothetical protein
MGQSFHIRGIALVVVAFSAVAPAECWAVESGPLIRLRLRNETVEGQPLWWSDRQVELLSRDGSLISFSPSEAKEFRKLGPRFTGYSASEMRGKLFAEFGADFDVATTSHYLVVHPRGEKNKWAERFENLYRSFTHYFGVRGFRIAEPRFPLVAVVFPSRAEYQAYARKVGERISPNYLGHYSSKSNRVYLFDSSDELGRGDWSQNAATIIHEATHQTAYNTGIHTRFADAPRWVVEGLATMFEAPGVWDSKSFRQQKERINAQRLADFRAHTASRPAVWIEQLLRSDQPFSSNPGGAYAEAWALSFYLSETRPRLYAKYLEKTAARAQFKRYGPDDRVADFTEIFGKNLKLFDSQFLRYMAKLR